MLQIILLLLATTPLSSYGLESMTADRRIYVGELTSPAYSIGSGYQSNYNGFPTIYNNGYHAFPSYSAPSIATSFHAGPLGGQKHFSNLPSSSNYGIAANYGGSVGGGLLGGQIEPLRVGNVAYPYITHRPIIGGQHTNIGALFGGGMRDMPIYLTNGHYIGHTNTYIPMGVLQSFT